MAKTDEEVQKQITHDLELANAQRDFELIQCALFDLQQLVAQTFGAHGPMYKSLQAARARVENGRAALARVSDATPWKRKGETIEKDSITSRVKGMFK